MLLMLLSLYKVRYLAIHNLFICQFFLIAFVEPKSPMCRAKVPAE
jgi:hypothetical protein